MRKVFFRQSPKLMTLVLLVLCFNLCSLSEMKAALLDSDNETQVVGNWEDNGKEERCLVPIPISIFCTSLYLTIQDSNPVNTVTVKITNQATGAMVFENVYPQGQTSYIVIPISNWDAGSYTIELFGRENNGYLWGNFQVLP